MKTELALVLVPVIIEVHLLVTPMIEAERFVLVIRCYEPRPGPKVVADR